MRPQAPGIGSPLVELPGRALSGTLRAVWLAVRLPLFALLAILEPVVRALLAGVALLVTLTALFLALVQGLAAFPFFGMLAVAVGLVLLLALYYAVLRRLSR